MTSGRLQERLLELGGSESVAYRQTVKPSNCRIRLIALTHRLDPNLAEKREPMESLENMERQNYPKFRCLLAHRFGGI
jgi:hypothetical protein